jgi:hypothetical protein
MLSSEIVDSARPTGSPFSVKSALSASFYYFYFGR